MFCWNIILWKSYTPIPYLLLKSIWLLLILLQFITICVHIFIENGLNFSSYLYRCVCRGGGVIYFCFLVYTEYFMLLLLALLTRNKKVLTLIVKTVFASFYITLFNDEWHQGTNATFCIKERINIIFNYCFSNFLLKILASNVF